MALSSRGEESKASRAGQTKPGSRNMLKQSSNANESSREGFVSMYRRDEMRRQRRRESLVEAKARLAWQDSEISTVPHAGFRVVLAK